MRTLIDFAIRTEYARFKGHKDDLCDIGSQIDWEIFKFLEPLLYKNQTACGHPTLKDGVCFGPHALTPGFMESRNRRAFVAQIPLDQNYRESVFGSQRFLVNQI